MPWWGQAIECVHIIDRIDGVGDATFGTCILDQEDQVLRKLLWISRQRCNFPLTRKAHPTFPAIEILARGEWGQSGGSGLAKGLFRQPIKVRAEEVEGNIVTKEYFVRAHRLFKRRCPRQVGP